MLIKGQKIEMRWNSGNKAWYESKGYIFTKFNDSFIVDVDDLARNSNARVRVVCDYCDEEYETSYVSYMNGHKTIDKDSCAKCGQVKKNEIHRDERVHKIFEKIRAICVESGYILLTKECEYTKAHEMRIKIVCPIHGIQEANLRNFLTRKRCPQCGLDKRTSVHRHSPDYIESVINSINNNILLNKNEYKNAHERNLQILCGECKEEVFVVSFSNYCHGVHRCKHCSTKESRGEFKIRKFLENNNIKFKKEFWFDDCRDKLPLPFDFYLTEHNILVEFDGQQHYDTWFYLNMNVDPELMLAECQKRDAIKTQYCQEHNIPLIRIPYFEEKNINKILEEQLNLNIEKINVNNFK